METATRALELNPDLAAAYFVRGWGRDLEAPGSDAALADVRKAAELSPSDRLFSASLQYLSGNR